MGTVFLMASKEIKNMARQRTLWTLLGVVIGLMLLGLYTGHQVYRQQKLMVDRASDQKRTEWLEQGEKHPHIAAHYGTYVFKPKTILSLFDHGLDTYTGTSVYLEAHYPHEFMFRPVQGYGGAIRFGELTAALVLQLLLPLLIIFITFQSFTKERETGTLRLLISQGVSVRSILMGKVVAFTLVGFIVLTPFFIGLYLLSGEESENQVITDVGLRTVLLFGIYALYLFVFTGFSVWVSLKSSSARNALLTLLTFWMVTGVIIPKTAANFGETLYPLPSMKAFKEGIHSDIANGMDGAGSRLEREARLKEDYLAHYGVTSLDQLPLNFEGVRMQEGEEYSNKVYDAHNDKLYARFEEQNRIGSLLAFVAPYMAVRNLSMAMAGTDWYSFNDFTAKTETYRRNLIRTMNRDMAENSRYGEFFEYKADEKLWESIEDFRYVSFTAQRALSFYRAELLALTLWVLWILFLMTIPRKIKNL
ncbi:DUF3526 domain-containing protein [Flagellimonas marinaquae]|uniref:DUF3526 domain-containing protein n=1 Tax=Flagellimonas aurea TaxID=2915619 RepID=A0ABS3G1A1_9FLAO|nr:DUF3526 domain-containing protein [Allomuricauda aurea]MAO18481.1 hypothetical protein [Allomuricauda sp.]MBO0352748.1 DUF3526 domain-containing protein [Allomuricauda aurea]UBZ15755.1 DUF3526 domain-containing protein [Allomuricauda aquimarina]